MSYGLLRAVAKLTAMHRWIRRDAARFILLIRSHVHVAMESNISALFARFSKDVSLCGIIKDVYRDIKCCLRLHAHIFYVTFCRYNVARSSLS